MLQLRLFIGDLRENMGVPYPLAHNRPWTAGRDLVATSQTSAGLPEEYWVVHSCQGLLTYNGQTFVDSVDFTDENVVGRWRPHADPRSPVRVDPLVRFGPRAFVASARMR